TEEKLPVNESYITKLIPVKYIRADEAIKFLRPLVSRDGHVSAFGPRNLLLVVDSAVNIEKVMSIIKLIDKPSTVQEAAKINVYFLENADATNLAKVLQGIVKDLRTSYKTSRRQIKRIGPTTVPVINVTPDKTTNSLIIVAPPSDYENIVQVIKKLDKRRKQVFVEAMIIEASIGRLKELGARWRAMARSNDEPVAIGGFGNISYSAVQSIISGLTGFSAGGMGNFLEIPVTTVSSSGTISTQKLTAPGFAALFSLNYFKNAVNVLSTPQILTSDNEEAEIVVGENVPFISKRERDLTTTNTVLSSIERKDVGITLRITPQITEGDYVKLNIFQEISAVKDTPESVLTTVGPTTTKRSTKTTIVVKDGHTVVIGGLMQEKEEKGTAKTPILGDIPILGWLFKFERVSKDKTNLLVFLSPHVIKEAPELSKITEEKYMEFVKREKFYASGELLVKFKEGVSEESARQIIAGAGASIIKYYEGIKVYHIRLKPGMEVEEAVREFMSIPEVLYAEPNYKATIQRPAEDSGKKKIAPAVENGDAGTSPAPSDEGPQSQEKDTGAAETAAAGNNNPPEDRRETAGSKKFSAVTDIPGGKSYFIQVGAWRNFEAAKKMLEKLTARYPATYILQDNNFNKVRIPGIKSKKEGELILKDLKEKFSLQPILVLKTKQG
ncbi:MAG: hypothetical protein GXP46_07185, partial [Deferribacteres bacterium]|nr:hypothetical protein [Deferribacteres bacterium]